MSPLIVVDHPAPPAVLLYIVKIWFFACQGLLSPQFSCGYAFPLIIRFLFCFSFLFSEFVHFSLKFCKFVLVFMDFIVEGGVLFAILP